MTDRQTDRLGESYEREKEGMDGGKATKDIYV